MLDYLHIISILNRGNRRKQSQRKKRKGAEEKGEGQWDGERGMGRFIGLQVEYPATEEAPKYQCAYFF
jgi:hypothetical protein